MITGIHILLTYSCTKECQHCFLFSHPRACGTFTINRLTDLFLQVKEIPSLEWVFFEGGEPFLFYPLLLEGLRQVPFLHKGVVTNSYWATTLHDALLWLRPLKDAGLENLTLSDDPFHHQGEDPLFQYALAAAKELGIQVETIVLKKPTPLNYKESGVMFRGRAALQLTEGLPLEEGKVFTSCPYEQLINPNRLHVDPYGNLHLCQGLLLGSLKKASLFSLLKGYQPWKHPIVKTLLKGGPALLASQGGLCKGRYVDACQLCFIARSSLIKIYPQWLAPRQVYGL